MAVKPFSKLCSRKRPPNGAKGIYGTFLADLMLSVMLSYGGNYGTDQALKPEFIKLNTHFFQAFTIRGKTLSLIPFVEIVHLLQLPPPHRSACFRPCNLCRSALSHMYGGI